MANYLNNNGIRPSILDIALSYENGNQREIKPKTRVVVNTNRIWYGENSTASAFLAIAYDEQGKEINLVRGYFLEPETKYEKAKTEGGKMAIMSGQYNIITNAEMLKKINKTLKKFAFPLVYRHPSRKKLCSYSRRKNLGKYRRLFYSRGYYRT